MGSVVQETKKLPSKRRRGLHLMKLRIALDMSTEPDIVLDFDGFTNLDFDSVKGFTRLRFALNVYTILDEVEWHFANVDNGWVKRTLLNAGFGFEIHHENVQDAADMAIKNAREKDVDSTV